MNLGYQSARTYWALVISGKTKAGSPPAPRARAAAPPRSRSQYHRPKAITLVSQIAPPLASRMLASVLNLAPPMIPATRRTAAEAFTAEIRPISVPVSTRSQPESRSMRPGSPMIITASRTRTTTMNTQRASPVLSAAGRTPRNTPAASTASAIGQRCSPVLGDREGSGSAGAGERGFAIGQPTSWVSRTSQVALCGYPPRGHRVDERLVVTLVLIGVRAGELRNGLVEYARAAQVGGDGDPVAGAGVCPRQRPAAERAVHPQAARHHGLDGEGEFPVPQLADIEVTRPPVQAGLGPLPAQEDVAGRLHQPLARHHPLALVGVLAGPDEPAEHRCLCLLDLQEQRI